MANVFSETTNRLTTCTTINSVVVHPELRKKEEVGIDFIDDALGGRGLTPSSVTLLAGAPGAGKSTLGLQICNSLMKNPNCITLFNSTEQSIEDIKMTSERVFNNKIEDFCVGNHRFVDKNYKGLQADYRKILDSGKETSILQNATEIRAKYPGKRLIVVIDSLQTVIDGKSKTKSDPITTLGLLSDYAKKTFSIFIVIGQVTKSGVFAGGNNILHDVDVYLDLGFERRKRSKNLGKRVLSAKKNRYGSSGKSYYLEMNRNGLYEVEDEDLLY